MIGKLIRDYLQENGIKQSFLAEQIGISDRAMSDICNSRRNIDVIEYYKICRVLGVSLNFFLEDVR